MTNIHNQQAVENEEHQYAEADPSSELFAHYANQYLRSGYEQLQKPIEEIRSLHLDRLPRWIERIPKNARIVDAGCAMGYLLSLFYAEGYTNLTGVDLSEEMVPIARQILPKEVNIIQSDVHDFLTGCEDGSFDVILFHHVLEHIPRENTIALLREFYRCLTPEGLLSIKTPNAAFILSGYHCFGDFTHVVHFNEHSLPQVLEAAGFEVNHIEFIQHPPKLFWSWQHPGRAILRLINRCRWNCHRYLHKFLWLLTDLHPASQVFEWEIEVLIRR